MQRRREIPSCILQGSGRLSRPSSSIVRHMVCAYMLPCNLAAARSLPNGADLLLPAATAGVWLLRPPSIPLLLLLLVLLLRLLLLLLLCLLLLLLLLLLLRVMYVSRFQLQRSRPTIVPLLLLLCCCCCGCCGCCCCCLSGHVPQPLQTPSDSRLQQQKTLLQQKYRSAAHRRSIKDDSAAGDGCDAMGSSTFKLQCSRPTSE